MAAASDSSPHHPSETTQASRAFLQHRVATFGLIAGTLGGGFLIFRGVAIAAYSQFGELNLTFWLHLAAVVAFLAVWLACRRGELSTSAVRRIEELGLLGGGSLYTMMGAHVISIARPEMIMHGVLTLMFLVRAIYVPSTSRRTFALTAAMGVPLLLAVYLVYRAPDAEVLAFYDSFVGQGASRFFSAEWRVSEAAMWWVLTALTSAAASKVIYGLRTEARDARRLGQYTLEQKLGAGGMGVVYRASHALLRRPTAVKLLASDAADDQSIARFEREVQRTAELTHPNTITIFDYGHTPDGVFYYAMELLDGSTLDDIVSCTGPQPAGRVVHTLRRVASALAEAHDVGLIHRDVKPANVMLCLQGGLSDTPKILDFGLVKEIDKQTSSSLTSANTITGTPQYLPPEAILAPESVDARTDLYALGAVGYFMLCGEHVFSGMSIVEVCGHHLHTEPTPPSERLGIELPSDLEALLMQCLKKDPEARPQSARALFDALGECQVERWTSSDATDWWARHGEAVAGLRDVPTGHEVTIAMQVARRGSAR